MSLQNLQTLLHTVNHGDNNTRAAAQIQLTNYEQQAVPSDVYNLIRQAGSDSTCLAYLLNVLLKLLLDRAETLQPNERVELRQFILEFAVAAETAKALPRFILIKCGKIIVDCAKLDWPHNYPDFFEQILQLCANNTLRHLGMGMLVTALEELPSRSTRRGRDIPLTNARRIDLQKGITNHLPQIVPTITSILNDPELCDVGLAALCQLFSSEFKIQNQVDGPLMDQLFRLMNNPNNPRCSKVINCLTQMVGRNCIPHDAEGFVMRVSTQMLGTLQAVVEKGEQIQLQQSQQQNQQNQQQNQVSKATQ